MEKQYWLAQAESIDKYGTIWNPKCTDGPHSSPEGVVKAKEIIQGIGLDRGQNRIYCMVTVELVPDLKVKVNQEAIVLCKTAMDFSRKKFKSHKE